MKDKNEIVETYKQLVIKKKSTKVSVSELCKTIHISRTTFYKYFKDVYDISEYILLNDGIYQIQALVDSNIHHQLVVESWYLSFYKNKEFYYYAIKDETQNSLFNTLILKLTEYNKSLFIKKVNEKDAEYYAYKYASSQAMLLKKWILEGMSVPPEKMAEYFVTDLLNEH